MKNEASSPLCDWGSGDEESSYEMIRSTGWHLSTPPSSPDRDYLEASALKSKPCVESPTRGKFRKKCLSQVSLDHPLPQSRRKSEDTSDSWGFEFLENGEHDSMPENLRVHQVHADYDDYEEGDESMNDILGINGDEMVWEDAENEDTISINDMNDTLDHPNETSLELDVDSIETREDECNLLSYTSTKRCAVMIENPFADDGDDDLSIEEAKVLDMAGIGPLESQINKIASWFDTMGVCDSADIIAANKTFIEIL